MYSAYDEAQAIMKSAESKNDAATEADDILSSQQNKTQKVEIGNYDYLNNNPIKKAAQAMTTLQPGIRRNGKSVNPYMEQWTGKRETKRKLPEVNAGERRNMTQVGGGYMDYGFNFNANADENNLGALDVVNELPKLSASQISAIISRHFSNSTVIKPSDAQGIYEAQQKSGMSALAILGIGALESGYGTSAIAKQKGNLWGWGATNDNPGGNAWTFSSGGVGAYEYASAYLKTYYNGYGAKTINSAGTGNNPAGKGYAYWDNGTINTQWATSVGTIMKNFYNTAKKVGVQKGGSAIGNKLVATAKKYLGVPYLWGGTSPSGFDCSGLMQYVFKECGIDINRTADQQLKNGTPVEKNQLQPGDLVFFKGYTKSATNPGHVGLYIGNGQYIQAPKTGDVVKISNLSARGDYVGARRVR